MLSSFFLDFDYIKPYYEAGLDAVIVQDLGVFNVIRSIFPDLNIHASTQMTVTGSNGARILKDMGASRIVTARELTSSEIRQIHDNVDIEIEAFVHGGMVMSYSGRRLLSNYMSSKENVEYDDTKHYNLVEEKRPGQFCPIYEDEGGTVFYASKDLCMIEFIPELIKSGVTTFSIEGNMKSDDYVGKVVKVYRKAIDEFIKNPEGWKFDKTWLEELQNIDHRVLTTGFYLEENIDYTRE